MFEVGQMWELVYTNEVVEVSHIDEEGGAWIEDFAYLIGSDITENRARLVASPPDEDGWRNWHGGPCPVEFGRVDIKDRDGKISLGWVCNHLDWNHEGMDDDIVAFRRHKERETIADEISELCQEEMNTTKAPHIVQQALKHMEDRAQTYDNPEEGERSIGATVEAFNVVTDGKMDTEEKGWLFMVLLKIVRSQQGNFKLDNYEDLSAYGALMGEAAYKERGDK